MQKKDSKNCIAKLIKMLSTEKIGISRSLYIISTFLHENAKNIKGMREIDK